MALLSPLDLLPNRSSGADEWVEFHKILNKSLPRKESNALWVKAWSKRGSNYANTRHLRVYMEKKGVKIDTNSWQNIQDASADLQDSIGSIFKTGKYITYGIIAVVLVTGTVFLWNIAKAPLSLIPAGRVAKGFKGASRGRRLR